MSIPAVSVLMPTYRQAAFLPRALNSLAAQTMRDWELVAVDDGSPDESAEMIAAMDWPRVTLLRFPHNRGLGAALNAATEQATGRYLAYLPSDDLLAPDQLARAVALLDARPEVHLAYGGVRWHPRPRVAASAPQETPTLRSDIAPGQEAELLDRPDPPAEGYGVPSGNLLALAQVVHRRGEVSGMRWIERDELVTDGIEAEYWRELLAKAYQFSYTGRIGCEWGDHPDQHHKIISGRGVHHADWRSHAYGLSRYKQYYQVPTGERLNWQPSNGGAPVDERLRYEGMCAAARTRAAAETGARPARPDGMRILLLGGLSFNPERVLAFVERGHRLYGLWMPGPHFWDNAAPVPFGGVQNVPNDGCWRERLEEIDPHVIYALLNWQSIPFIHDVFRQRPRAPFIFHFKESPFTAMQAGYWPALRDLVLHCDGRIFSSVEERDWFELALGQRLDDARTLVLDGDLPKADWATDEWSPRLSDLDGEPHTACVGRSFTEPVAELARRGVHVHLYTHPYMRFGAAWRRAATAAELSHVHLHSPVMPGEWVRELSRYDAGWLHAFSSHNNGNLLMATWDDLNVPARAATYALAGLPWLMRDSTGHRVAVRTLADRFGVAIPYHDYDDLANRLHSECASRSASVAMRANRSAFTFDRHVDDLVDFMRAGDRRASETREASCAPSC